MSDNGTVSADQRRRRFLVATAALIGGAGAAAAAVPFIASMNPSARVRAAGAPVDVDIGSLQRGHQLTVKWRGKPVWVLRRTPEMLAGLQAPALRERLRDPDSKVETQQPEYAENVFRSIKPEYLVAVGLCTHLGCVPSFRPERAPADLGADWPGGYFCPCHGSRFDLAGRVYEGVPAPTNLVVPRYRLLSEHAVRIGEDTVKPRPAT